MRVARAAPSVYKKSPPRAAHVPEVSKVTQAAAAAVSSSPFERVLAKKTSASPSPIGRGKENPLTGRPRRPSREISPSARPDGDEGTQGRAGEPKAGAEVGSAAGSPNGEMGEGGAETRNERMFQRSQNVRCRVSEQVAADVGVTLSGGQGKRETDGDEMDEAKAALAIARRRRAARALFGLGSEETQPGDETVSARLEEKEKAGGKVCASE